MSLLGIPQKVLTPASLIFALTGSLSITLTADDSTWNGAGSDDSWATADNWDAGTVPGSTSGSTTTDVASFGVGPVNTLIDVDADRLIHTIEFVDASTPGYTFTGETLRIAAGGGIGRGNLGGQTNQIFNVPILLQTSDAVSDGIFTFSENSSNPSSAQLIYNGDVSASTTTGGVTLLVRGNNWAGHDFGGVISDGGAAGGLTLDISHGYGGGTTILRQANTYSGGTVIGSARISAFSGNAFGTGDITINSLMRMDGGAGNLTFDNNINLNGAISVVNSGTYTFNGDITLGTEAGATPELNQNQGTTTYNGVISDGSFIVPLLGPDWGGGIALNGDNTFSGGFVMQSASRSVTLGHENALGTGTLVVSEAGGDLRGGTLSLSNDIELNGQLNLVGTTFTFTGDMQVGVDALATDLVLYSNNRVTVFEGAISDGGNDRTLTVDRGRFVFANDNTLTGDIVVERGTLQIGNGGSTGLIGTSKVTVKADTALRFDRTGGYTAVNAIDGAGDLEIQGGGSASFSGALTHTGGTRVTDNSALRIDGSFDGGAGISVEAGSTFGGSGGVELGSGELTLAAGAFLSAGSELSRGVLSIDNSVLDLSAIRGEGEGALVFRLGGEADSDRIDFGGTSTVLLVGGTGEGLTFDDFAFSTDVDFTGGDYLLFENVSFFLGEELVSGETTGLINGYEAELFYVDNGFGGGDISLSVVVPEPAAAATLLGLLSLASVNMRRRRGV